MGHSNPSLVVSREAGISLQPLLQAPDLTFDLPLVQSPQVRLIRLDEINEERHQAYRQALSNVYATLDAELKVRLLYLMVGEPTGIALYFGVVADDVHTDVHEAMKNLRGALEGQLPGINFGVDMDASVRGELLGRLGGMAHQGVMLGAPTEQAPAESGDEQNFQGVDRLVRALQAGGRADMQGDAGWYLAVVSQPLPRETVRNLLDEAYGVSSQLASMVSASLQTGSNSSQQNSVSMGTSLANGTNEGTSKTRGTNESGSETTSKGTSSSQGDSESSRGKNAGTSQAKTLGTSDSISQTDGTSRTESTNENRSASKTEGSSEGWQYNIANKRAQHLMEYLDKQVIARLQKGLTKGLFQSAVYLAAENRSTYQRLKHTLRATFQGSEATLSPLQTYDLPFQEYQEGRLPLGLPSVTTTALKNDLLFHSLLDDRRTGLGSLLTADELAVVAGLPHHELQGIRRRKTVNFIVDLPDTSASSSLDLGAVIDRGRRYPSNRVRLARADLNKHVFVTGVTGAGKTTTCLNLLLESGLPFLVIEPAKTEYRELAQRLPGQVAYYRPNGEDYQSLRLNPFALVRKGQRIKSHAGFLKNAFTAVFPMEASMPMMVEAAILAAYEAKGWDIDENEFLGEGDPFEPASRAWPTMSEMIEALDRLIPTYGLGKDFEEKYRGSLVSRLRSLTDGTLGQVLDAPQSIDFGQLLQGHVVIELEELQGGEEKALLMALLLGGVSEAIRARHAQDPDFRQLTLIEEAHRLLSRPEPGDKASAMAVEAFADMLAEVRKYGVGLIIADQIPAKLIPDVIKNTHCKIVHRLFAEDDRRAMGETMMMDDAQRNFLPNLATGEAIVFCGGWHGAAHAAIRNDHAQTDNRSVLDIDACAVQQLWQQRTRYYPQFCQLGWLGETDYDPARFAAFVRQTRQALNQLLCLSRDGQQPTTRQEGALRRLLAWHATWQPLAEQEQLGYGQWRAAADEPWPESLLAAAWFALLLDGSASLTPQAGSVASLYPRTLEEREALIVAIESLMTALPEMHAMENWTNVLTDPVNRSLKKHVENLKFFKKI